METPNLTNLEAEASNESTSPQRLQELVRTSPELARWVAANSSAPSELLRELSENEDAIVREAVTGNPNTPTEILLEANIDRILDMNYFYRLTDKMNKHLQEC